MLDAFARVTALRSPRGGLIPPGGSVLSGTGDAADWLRAHARIGARVRVRTVVRSERALRRNPPTMAGVARDGRLLLVAVDGRAPGYSAGLNFEEEAAVVHDYSRPLSIAGDRASAGRERPGPAHGLPPQPGRRRAGHRRRRGSRLSISQTDMRTWQ